MRTASRLLRLLSAAALVVLTLAFTVVSSADARVHHTHARIVRTHTTHVRARACYTASASVLLKKRSRHARSRQREARLRTVTHINRPSCTATTSGSAGSTSPGTSSSGSAGCGGCSSSTTDPSTGSSPPSTGSSTPTPTPAPISTPPSSGGQSDTVMGSGGSGWDGYGGNSIPGASWRPYADSSPFNQTVAGASIVPNSQTYVNDALQWGDPSNMATTANTSMDYSHPTYYAQPSDPTYTLNATGGYSPAIQGMQIQIPSYARPADGGDAHMTVIEPDGWEYDFWQVQSMSNGVLTYTAGGRTLINGDGLGSNATAAHFGNLAGMIRAPELESGQIDHALFIVLKCTSSDASFGYGTQTSPSNTGNGSYVYPAGGGGAPCPSGESSVPLGTRFMLDMTPSQIQALAVPTWKKTILTALATYGGYVGDTGGSGFGFMFESSMTYTQLGLSDPLASFGAQNNLPTWDSTFVYNMSSGVDWQQYLKVITPPAAA
jgi:hypothetical protein